RPGSAGLRFKPGSAGAVSRCSGSASSAVARRPPPRVCSRRAGSCTTSARPAGIPGLKGSDRCSWLIRSDPSPESRPDTDSGSRIPESRPDTVLPEPRPDTRSGLGAVLVAAAADGEWDVFQELVDLLLGGEGGDLADQARRVV